MATAKPKIRTAYGPVNRVTQDVGGPSMTEQNHKKACDINSIMAKYNKTGLVDHINNHQAKYGDVSGADFENAQNLIADQKTIFHELPANVRFEFDNDPAQYLDLVMTDEGVEELGNLLNPVDPEPEKEAPERAQEASEQVKAEEPAVT